MSCITMGFALNLCIWIVVIIALISILRLVVPWLASWAGLPSIVLGIINIVIWAVIAIAVIYVIFALVGCLLGGGGLMLHHYG